MKAIRKGLISLLGLVISGSVLAEEQSDFYFVIGAGALSSFKQSTGQSPTIEFGV